MGLPQNAFGDDYPLGPDDLTPEVMQAYNRIDDRAIFASAFAPRSAPSRPFRPTTHGDIESEIFESAFRD